jgi:hypothetical protein
MHEIVSKTAELHVPAVAHERWRNRDFQDAAGRNELHRVGPSFAEVGIRQSATPHVQAKLTVSHPADSAEKEADRVADAVMQMPASQPAIGRQEDPAVQRACAACAKPETEERVDRAAEEEDEVQRAVDGNALDRMAEEDDEVKRAVEEKEDEKLQAKSRSDSVPQVTPELDARIHSAHGSGAPLPRETRAFFEPRLGADLSNVRVTAGSQASSVARQLNARAFTVGNNITFGAGQYQPSSSDGKRLIAHELTHVIQQGGARGVPRGNTSEG